MSGGGGVFLWGGCMKRDWRLRRREELAWGGDGNGDDYREDGDGVEGGKG